MPLPGAGRRARPQHAPGVAALGTGSAFNERGGGMNPADATHERPRSLKAVAVSGQAWGNTDAFLREFLDAFYTEPDQAARAAMLAPEPPIGPDARMNAYLAATAEHLAQREHLPVPRWTWQPERFLHRPFFPGGLESLKAILLAQSPAAFRRRMIFVEADPLDRPRRSAPSDAG